MHAQQNCIIQSIGSFIQQNRTTLARSNPDNARQQSSIPLLAGMGLESIAAAFLHCGNSQTPGLHLCKVTQLTYPKSCASYGNCGYVGPQCRHCTQQHPPTNGRPTAKSMASVGSVASIGVHGVRGWDVPRYPITSQKSGPLLCGCQECASLILNHPSEGRFVGKWVPSAPK